MVQARLVTIDLDTRWVRLRKHFGEALGSQLKATSKQNPQPRKLQRA